MQENPTDVASGRSSCAMLLRCALLTAALTSNATVATAAQSVPGGGLVGPVERIAIVLARELREAPAPVSLLDAPPTDDGVAGARLAINDNNTTGRFLRQ